MTSNDDGSGLRILLLFPLLCYIKIILTGSKYFRWKQLFAHFLSSNSLKDAEQHNCCCIIVHCYIYSSLYFLYICIWINNKYVCVRVVLHWIKCHICFWHILFCDPDFSQHLTLYTLFPFHILTDTDPHRSLWLFPTTNDLFVEQKSKYILGLYCFAAFLLLVLVLLVCIAFIHLSGLRLLLNTVKIRVQHHRIHQHFFKLRLNLIQWARFCPLTAYQSLPINQKHKKYYFSV